MSRSRCASRTAARIFSTFEDPDGNLTQVLQMTQEYRDAHSGERLLQGIVQASDLTPAR